jgi:hypothetical protein
MDTSKTTQLEQNTANALESFDPFANLPVPGFSMKKYNRDKEKENLSRSPESASEPMKKRKPRQKKEKPVKKPRLKKIQPVEVEDIKPTTNPIVESRTPEGMPSYRCEFGGRDIFVGLLSYKTTNPVTAMVLTALALDFGRDKIRFDLELGNSMIYQARNRLAAKFLETDARWMLMLDDDMIPCIGRPEWMRHWVPGARTILDQPLQRHIVHRLVGNNKTVCGAAYFERREGAGLVCSDQGLVTRAKTYEDAVVEVDWLGTGAMLVHRRVFEDITKTYPDIAGNFFHPIDGKTGEDISFCIRAKKSGHPTFCDLAVPTFHVGYKTY